MKLFETRLNTEKVRKQEKLRLDCEQKITNLEFKNSKQLSKLEKMIFKKTNKWHIVELEFYDEKGLEELYQKIYPIEEWIINNCNDDVMNMMDPGEDFIDMINKMITVAQETLKVYFYFKNPNEAMQFKLVWGSRGII